MNEDIAQLLRNQAETIGELGKRLRALERKVKEPLPILRRWIDAQDRVGYAYFNSPLGTHFDDDSRPIPSDMDWAGAPFVVPTSYVNGFSMLRFTSLALGGGRSFLYRNGANSSLYTQAFKVSTIAGHSTANPISIGVRVDDGTDNNYVEVVLRADLPATLPYYTYYFRHRTGAGAVTTTAISTNFIHFDHVMVATLEGTAWTNWSIRPIIYAPGTGLWLASITGRAWTPTRQGLIFDANGASVSWHSFTVDAWGSTYY